MTDETETKSVPPRQPTRKPLPALARGTLVGRYVILDRLGLGGMGIVYRAYDPDLHRPLALKLVRAVSKETSARLLREGRALAKVSHPNIVQVFDVGVFGETVFIAMELVEGKTLIAWARETPREWRTLLGHLIDAGRGLAAAHAADLVHRDFKPHNVIVGTDGRVRVLDFGVARRAVWLPQDPADPTPPGDEDEHDEQELDDARADSTQSEDTTHEPATVAAPRDGLPQFVASRLTGTWGYMAPEQRKQGVLDARADQFAFAVTCWELLHGERPFAGKTNQEYADAAAAGRIRPPPAGNTTPAWIRRVLQRALSPSPGDRYRSMDELLGALSIDPARRRNEYITAAAVIAGAAMATLAIASLGGSSSPCEDAARHMDGVWDPATAARLDQAFRGTGVAFAADAAAKVTTALDRKRARWVAMHGEACRATRVTGEQSATLLDLRMGCLARRREELRALVAQLVTAPDAARVATSVEAVAKLPSIDTCADRDALAAVIPPPADPMRRAEAEQARAELATIKALLWTGQWPDARTRAEQVQARARRIDWAPLGAEADLLRGLAERHAGSARAAETALAEATQLAARAHLDAVSAQAFSELAWVVGYEEERHAEGLALATAAEAAALRSSASPTERASVAHTRASILLAKGEHAAALREAERALALIASAPEPDELERADILNTAAMVHTAQGDYPAAEAAHREVLALRRAALGENHPKVADSLDNLGVVRFHRGAFDEAKRLYEQALALRIATLGPGHRDVGTSHNNLGGLLMDAGDERGAAQHLEAALKIYEAALGPTHADLAIPLSNLGELATHRGDFAEALRFCERALAIDAATGPEDPKLAYDLVCIGEAHLGRGDTARAREVLERALKLREPGDGDAGELARTRFDLARALPAAERTRARDLAVQAREGFATAGDAWKERRAQVVAWLGAPAQDR